MMKRFIRILIPNLIIFIGVIILFKAQSPFKTKEEKQVKKLYQYSIHNINTFKLKKVKVESNEGYVQFIFSRKKGGVSNPLREDELEDINTIVERMVQYLNEKDHLNWRYEHISIKFYDNNGRFPQYLQCSIGLNNQKYFFDGIVSQKSSGLYDLSIMKSATRIYLETGMPEYNDEEMAKFDGNNLKEIYFTCGENYTGKDLLKAELLSLKKGLQVVLPNIKIYLNEKEVEMQDEN